MPLNYYSTFLDYSAASLLFAGQSRHTVSKQWASTSGRPTVAGLRPKGLAPRRRPSSPTARRSLGGPPPDGRRRSPRVSARPRGGHGSRRWPPRSGARRCLGESPPVRAEASPAGLRSVAGLRASALSGAPSPWRVPAGPGGGITSRSPPGSGACRRLGGSPPCRAETSSVGLRPAAQGPCWRACADRERPRLSTYAHLGKIVCLISLEIRLPPPVIPETPA